jgi:hypothetical protein
VAGGKHHQMAKNGKNTEKDRIFHTTKGEKLGNDNKR